MKAILIILVVLAITGGMVALVEITGGLSGQLTFPLTVLAVIGLVGLFVGLDRWLGPQA
jgi:hypothetical protein